jgi:ribosomal protein S27AE
MTKHKQSNKYEKYDEEGNFQGEKCPRCSSHLATHQDRKTCGNCGYVKHE